MEVYKYYTLTHDVVGRYANALCYLFSKMSFSVYIEKDNRQINAKSLIGLLSSGYKKGDSVKIYVQGNEDNINDIVSRLKEIE